MIPRQDAALTAGQDLLLVCTTQTPDIDLGRQSASERGSGGLKRGNGDSRVQ